MMRVPVRLLAGSTVAAAAVLLALLAPAMSHPWAVSPPPVGVGTQAFGDEDAHLGAPSVAVPPSGFPRTAATSDWIRRVRSTLDTMGLPIRGERLETLLRSVDQASSQFDVDPVTVLAVILVESRFDSEAVSPRGATGLMQLRVDTARELAGDLGVDWTSDDLLLDPDVNVRLGTYYLSVLLRRFGDEDTAFAAFHAGPGRIAASDGAYSRDYPARVWDAVVRLRIRPLA